MGTSTNYTTPPQWGPLKSGITAVAGRVPTQTRIADLIREHIATNGGSSKIATEGGVLGAGGASQHIAARLGGFVSQVARVGLAETLQERGMSELVGRPVNELLMGIISLCGGTNGSLDASDARSALSRLMDRMLAHAKDAAEVEAILNTVARGASLATLLVEFFAFYLYEQFCRVFFEHLVARHGHQRAESFLSDILDFICATLRNYTLGQDVAEVDWFGPEGERLSSSILQLTLEVFER